jgi:hypothetical protein
MRSMVEGAAPRTAVGGERLSASGRPLPSRYRAPPSPATREKDPTASFAPTLLSL